MTIETAPHARAVVLVENRFFEDVERRADQLPHAIDRASPDRPTAATVWDIWDVRTPPSSTPHGQRRSGATPTAPIGRGRGSKRPIAPSSLTWNNVAAMPCLCSSRVAYYELTDHFEVKADLPTTWRFFSAVENLAKITPPWLAFTVRMDGPVELGDGSLLDYTIKWMGFPIKWRTRIIDWSPPRQFIDIQLRGPYALWHHQHVFEPSDGGVVCRDRVIYKLPVAPIAPLVHALVVKEQLTEIFRFRRQVIAQELGWVRAIQEDVVVTKV